MAKTLEEAKRYLVSKTREKAEEMIPGYMVSVTFRKGRGEFVRVNARNVGYWSKSRMTTEIIFNEEMVRANIYNIENPYFLDLIVHELSHTPVFLQMGNYMRTHGRLPPIDPHSTKLFRDTYKTHAGSLSMIGPYTPSEIGDFNKYYGGKGYGYAPTNILKGDVKMCRNCGNIGLYKRDSSGRCFVCGRSGELITVKKATPRDVIDYIGLDEKYGSDSYEAQQRLKKRYTSYVKSIPISKHQKARHWKIKKQVAKKKSTMLQRAMRMVRL